VVDTDPLRGRPRRRLAERLAVLAGADPTAITELGPRRPAPSAPRRTPPGQYSPLRGFARRRCAICRDDRPRRGCLRPRPWRPL